MNVPVKAPTLDDLHKQRADLLKKRAEIAEARQKLSSVASEAAADALVRFGNGAAANLENWTAGGCRGPRPGADPAKYAELTKANFVAQHALQMAAGAKNSLDRRDETVTEARFIKTISLSKMPRPW